MRDYEVFYPFVVATFFAEIFCGSHILRLWHTDFTQTMNSYQQQYVDNYEERR